MVEESFEITNAITVPEDEGTGLPEGEADFTSAGHFAGLVGQSVISDYVESGMSFENVSEGTFDITGGLAFILYEGGVSVQDIEGDYVNEWDQPVRFAIKTNMIEGVEYIEADLNHVYINIELSENNAAEYVVNTTGEQPEGPSLKIGEIDDI